MITSVSNKRIKEVLEIKKNQSKSRNLSLSGSQPLFIEGKRIIDAALSSKADIKTIFYSNEYSRGNPTAQEQVLPLNKNIETIEVAEHIMKKICDTITPQGIAAIVSYNPFQLSDINKSERLTLLICDRIKDPGNMGNAIRAADGLGADAVIILSGSCNPYAPKVIRAGCGSIFNIPIVFTDINKLLLWMKGVSDPLKEDIALIATHPHEGISIYSADINSQFKRFGLVIGEEGGGVDPMILAKADLTVTIPLKGGAESLNAATSAAICLYEVMRER